MPARKAPAERAAVRYPSRLKRAQRQQRLILGSGIAAILLVLSLLGFGYYYYRLAPAREPVLLVNASPVTAAQIAAWGKIIRQGALQAVDPAALINRTMEEVRRSEIIRQKAPELGISLSPQEVEDLLRSSFSPEESFEKAYPRLLRELGVSDGQYREFIAAQLRQQKVLEHFASQQPQEMEQVHLYALMVTEEEKAKALKARAEAGEDFSTLAREFSQDVNLKEKGGDLGWMPPGIYTQFDLVAFTLQVGEVSDPLPLPGSYFLLKVTGREVRPLEEEDRLQFAFNDTEKWLQKHREASQIESLLDARKRDWVASHLR